MLLFVTWMIPVSGKHTFLFEKETYVAVSGCGCVQLLRSWMGLLRCSSINTDLPFPFQMLLCFSDFSHLHCEGKCFQPGHQFLHLIHLAYLFLWFPSLVLHVGLRCSYSADQELGNVYFQISGTLISGSLNDQWSCSIEWMELERVQGAAQVTPWHLWRGASNSRAFLVCRAGTGRFWSVPWGLEEKWV